MKDTTNITIKITRNSTSNLRGTSCMIDDTITEYVKANSLRECQFYWNYLLNKAAYQDEFINEPRSKDEYLRSMDEFLSSLVLGSYQADLMLVGMYNAYLELRISDEILEDISIKDDRLCYWLWYKLTSNDIGIKELSNIYSELSLPSKTFSTKERHTVITKYFDNWKEKAREKEYVLRKLLKEWSRVKKIESFSWVNIKDSNQVDWLYTKIMSSPVREWNKKCDEPSNTIEKRIVAIGCFDISDKSEDGKENFIIKLKKAWSQQKHRNKIKAEDKSSCSVVMNTRTKKRLDEMAASHGMSRSNFLEWLINQEFNNI